MAKNKTYFAKNGRGISERRPGCFLSLITSDLSPSKRKIIICSLIGGSVSLWSSVDSVCYFPINHINERLGNFQNFARPRFIWLCEIPAVSAFLACPVLDYTLINYCITIMAFLVWRWLSRISFEYLVRK